MAYAIDENAGFKDTIKFLVLFNQFLVLSQTPLPFGVEGFST